MRAPRPSTWLPCLALAACSTDPAELESIRVEGRVYDAESLIGLTGVSVTLLHAAGPMGVGSSGTVSTDGEGRYLLAVEFDSPQLCEPGTYDLGFEIPEGYRPALDDFERLECVETTQHRDFRMWPDGAGT